MSEVEVLIISSYSRHLELFPKPQGLLETSSSKDLKPARHKIMSYVSLILAATRREHLGACYLSIGINYNFSVLKIVGMRESTVAVLCLTILDLCIGLWFYPALVMRVPMFSKNELLSPSGGCRARDLPTKATRHVHKQLLEVDELNCQQLNLLSWSTQRHSRR